MSDCETHNMTSSPLKMKLYFGIESTRLTIANNIRARKVREKEENEAREKAFDEGLIGLGGTVAAGVENVVLICLVESEEVSTRGESHGG